MIVFNYKQIHDVDACHFVIRNMRIPGEPRCTPLQETDKGQTLLVWRDDKFMALFYPAENVMELYPTKNTNSVNYFIARYPELDWDTWHQIKTKRW